MLLSFYIDSEETKGIYEERNILKVTINNKIDILIETLNYDTNWDSFYLNFLNNAMLNLFECNKVDYI